MDALADVLRAMRLYGSIFFTAEFTAPWALASPNLTLLGTIVLPTVAHLSLFQILVEGECIIECDGESPVALASGDA